MGKFLNIIIFCFVTIFIFVSGSEEVLGGGLDRLKGYFKNERVKEKLIRLSMTSGFGGLALFGLSKLLKMINKPSGKALTAKERFLISFVTGLAIFGSGIRNDINYFYKKKEEEISAPEFKIEEKNIDAVESEDGRKEIISEEKFTFIEKDYTEFYNQKTKTWRGAQEVISNPFSLLVKDVRESDILGKDFLVIKTKIQSILGQNVQLYSGFVKVKKFSHNDNVTKKPNYTFYFVKGILIEIDQKNAILVLHADGQAGHRVYLKYSDIDLLKNSLSIVVDFFRNNFNVYTSENNFNSCVEARIEQVNKLDISGIPIVGNRKCLLEQFLKNDATESQENFDKMTEVLLQFLYDRDKLDHSFLDLRSDEEKLQK